MLREELREKMRTERLMGYFKSTRGWGEGTGGWLGEGVLAGWGVAALQLRILDFGVLKPGYLKLFQIAGRHK